MTRFKAAVMGGTGYAGAELIRRLLGHPSVDLVRVGSIAHVGEPLSSAHPNLEGMTDLRFESLSPAEVARDIDVVLMGMPTPVSARLAPELLDAGARVVDLSGAFRLANAESYEKVYGEPHPHPRRMADFVYGLPELHRERIAAASAVASPGCFATTIEIGLLPLALAGMLRGSIDTVGITGSSGSGAAPSPTTHHPARAGNLRAYRALTHQHAPEVEATLHQAGADATTRIRFIPVSAPLVRGILATSFAHVPEDLSENEIARAYEDFCGDRPFVRQPRSRLPEVIAVAGSNYAEVGCVLGDPDDRGRLVTCFSALDNLIKGGAGQAIQCMNLMLGLEERGGLTDPGSYP